MSPAVPRRRALAVLFLAAAWLSAGSVPVIDAVAGARAPVDFARDYVTAHAWIHQGHGPPPVGEAGNVYAAKLGAPQAVLLGGPYHLHPPPALLPVLPLAMLGFGGAALAWLTVSVLALAMLAFIVAEVLAETLHQTSDAARGPSAAFAALVFFLALLWPPVLHDLAKGQWSILLAVLIAAGWRALARDRPRAAGVWLGLAASLKATPLLLLGFLVLRHRRAALAMIATLAAALGVSLIASGVEPWRALFADAPRDVAAWQTWTANTASLNGLVARLFAGGQFARPLVEAPAMARVASTALAAIVIGSLALATMRADRSPASDRALFAAWAIATVLLNPLAWTHTVVIALVPLALLVGIVPTWMLVPAFVSLTLPREVLAILGGAPPVSPWRGVLLSCHAVALLGVFALALAHARRRSGVLQELRDAVPAHDGRERQASPVEPDQRGAQRPRHVPGE